MKQIKIVFRAVSYGLSFHNLINLTTVACYARWMCDVRHAGSFSFWLDLTGLEMNLGEPSESRSRTLKGSDSNSNSKASSNSNSYLESQTQTCTQTRTQAHGLGHMLKSKLCMLCFKLDRSICVFFGVHDQFAVIWILKLRSWLWIRIRTWVKICLERDLQSTLEMMRRTCCSQDF